MIEREVTIGDCRLIQGDCLAVLPMLGRGSVDAIVTDPPYSSGGAFRGDRMQTTRAKYQSGEVLVEHPDFTGDNRDQRGYAYWVALWLSECCRVAAPGAMLCQFTDWRQLPTTTDAIQAGGWVWRGIAPWDKINARPIPNRFRAQCEYIVWGTNGPRSTETEGATYGDGIISVLTTPTADREHSTQKPVDLMKACVEVSCGPCGVVFDPFMGSGTTGVACVRTGRKFIGIEKDAGYFDVACRRIREAYDAQALFCDTAKEARNG